MRRDPLPLCVYATVAALTWWLGPIAVAGFGALAFAGYLGAWRSGSRESAGKPRGVRLSLAYLGVLTLAGAAGAGWRMFG
ncbi:hypothetical protein [Actinoplanes subtropicus]|uniref:hypothetical protein n=1 Tax=Actinoplanes subtropicus TaxID=543632 RepID=UPI000691E9B1|nr:hypothetical protein [Actinoplanes subtropicus]